jgi:cysteinyl-tRNA synthetase
VPKAAKNYGEADRIGASLLDYGIERIDQPGGLTDWLWG